MITYVIKRLLQAIVVLIIVTLVVFLLMRILPGDPILMFMSESETQSLDPQQLEFLRHKYGLDQPLMVQYGKWISGILRGDFGKSIFYNLPVSQLLSARIPVSLCLGLISFIIANTIGITAGIISAVRRGKFIDLAVTFFANIGVTAPIFWVAIILLYGFGLKLQWLPIGGWVAPWDNLGESIKYLILPVFCLSIFIIGASARQARSSMLEVLHQDYIRTAWSKGLSERMVLVRHLLKNGIIPLVTLMGMHVSQILGGAVLIETVFNIQGIGILSVDAVLNQDYIIIQDVTLIMAIMVVLANLIVDISYGWLDPRVRYA
jgi:peptide/nickel transport system permease protein